jgi:hypothetical protein
MRLTYDPRSRVSEVECVLTLAKGWRDLGTSEKVIQSTCDHHCADYMSNSASFNLGRNLGNRQKMEKGCRLSL